MGLTSLNRMRRLQEQQAGEEEQADLQAWSFPDLRAEAKRLQIEGYGKMTKQQLVEAISGNGSEVQP